MVLIVGASVRAAAFSALRAGFDPVAIDLFADWDLQHVCQAHRLEPANYPEGLATQTALLPRSPWCYTGAIENHPDLIDRITRDRPLWGNSGEVVRRVRDPFALTDLLRRFGLPAVDTRRHSRGLPTDGSWLVKRLRSAGGAHIRPFIANEPGPSEGIECLQRRLIGPSGSAVFVGTRGGSARLVGVTRQWIGHEGAAFGYLGSLGPVRVARNVQTQLQQLGAVLAGEFELRGLFGVDFVLSHGKAWPVEVNPRPTASVEVLEWATGRSLFREHAEAFNAEDAENVYDGHETCPDHRPMKVGKLVVFAPVEGRVPDAMTWKVVDPRSGPWPKLADLPPPGTVFQPGQPVLTLLDAAATASACRSRLIRRLARWRTRLRSWGEATEPPPNAGQHG
ncbi:ATP-grasp domain-containing protein [Tautonia marina]|uniref:ATP-grasp domain-containing protein n=1 Tax=Tautonia marina TaxID=2653855 RepID=UPI001F18A6D2|nr:ATP-grasp domain-containing protein [Tautonia marina]